MRIDRRMLGFVVVASMVGCVEPLEVGAAEGSGGSSGTGEEAGGAGGGGEEAKLPPIILVVQDRSGSMAQDFDGGTRAQALASTVPGVIEESSSGALFGLLRYGIGGDGGCTTVDGLRASLGGQQILPGPDNQVAIRAAYQETASQSVGGTPTTAALTVALEMLVDPGTGRSRIDGSPACQWGARDGCRQHVVILITDGAMNCNPDRPVDQSCLCANLDGDVQGSHEDGCQPVDAAYGESFVPSEHATGSLPASGLAELCLDEDGSLAALAELRGAGVQTFVVGMLDPADTVAEGALERLAQAGAPAPRDLYRVGTRDELTAALRAIVQPFVSP